MGAIESPIVQVYIGINILAAMSMFIWMYAGQFCLATGGLMCIAAYLSSVLTLEFHVPLIAAMLVSAIATAIVGTALVVPALRMRGFYLAIATLGFGELVVVFFRLFPHTGQLLGYGGMTGTTVPLTYIAVAICFLFTWRLLNSRFGWALKAIRLDEEVASTMGINVLRTKIIVFAIGGVFAGLAGVLQAHFLSFIRGEHFGFGLVIVILTMIVLGGMETPWGAIIGAAVLTLLPEYFRFLTEYRMIVYGIGVVVMMMVRPSGLISERDTRVIEQFFRKVGQRVRLKGG